MVVTYESGSASPAAVHVTGFANPAHMECAQRLQKGRSQARWATCGERQDRPRGRGRLNEEALENGDEIGWRRPMVAMGEQAIASPEPILSRYGFRRGNEQMSCQILHGSLHSRFGNGNGCLGEGLLAPRLPEPGVGLRCVPGIFLMGLAAATSLLGDGCGKRGVGSESLPVIPRGCGTARAFAAAAGLPGEEGQTEGLDVAIRAAAVKMRSASDQRHDRRQPDRTSLDCPTENHTFLISDLGPSRQAHYSVRQLPGADQGRKSPSICKTDPVGGYSRGSRIACTRPTA